MSRVYIGAGSNLGDRLNNLRKAHKTLASMEGIKPGMSSAFFETESEGGPLDAPKYLNAVWEIETDLLPGECLKVLQEIENTFGRTRAYAAMPRSLDLDLLAWDDLILEEENLSLPHPRLHERFFVLKPLCDLAPHWNHPQLKLSAKKLLENLLENIKKS